MAEKDYGAITDPDQLDELARRIVDEGKPFGYDIETGYEGPDMEGFSLHPETGFVVGFSFTNSITWARYVPVAHDLGPNMDRYRAAVALWLMLRTGWGVAHNGGFEEKMLRIFFLELLSDHPIFGAEVVKANGYHPIRSDTMIESYVRAATQVHGLKPLTKIVFNHEMRTIESLFPDMTKKQEKALRFNVLDLSPEVIAYACEDALWCLALHLEWYASIKDSFVYQMDMAVLREVLPEMGRTGLMYDWSMMRDGAEKAEIFREHMRQEISEDLSEMVGHPVNINLGSPKQVSEILFEKLGMKTTVYTANTRNLPKNERKMSTGALALKGLSKQFPVVKRILQWKEVKRLGNAFLETYEKKFGYAPDGMTHPDLLQCAVISGRFAHSSPNYAQSPKKYYYKLRNGKEFSYNFRAGIRAPRDFYILGFDLSQAELRAIAGEAQEQGLLSAFASGVDVHCQTAALMLRVPVEQVIAEHAAGDSSKRDIGKAQPVDSPVLTPTGWRRFGDLEVGDFVVGSDGLPTKVTGVFPQGVREVFTVTTSDGATAESCGEHLWTVRNVNTKDGPWRTRELRQLVASGLRQGTAKGKYSQPKYQLPDRPVVQYTPGPELPIDPYVLGLMLGDGSMTTKQELSYVSADRELMDAVRDCHEAMGGVWSEKETRPGFWTGWFRSGVLFSRSHNQLKRALEELGLRGCVDHTKFVPETYLRSSPADRLALLQGLLDTDGNVSASGAQFRVVSEQLARAVQELARSLGGWASLTQKPLETTSFHTKSEPKQVWEVYLRLPDGLCPFRLTRKIAKWKSPKYRAPQTIVSVVSAGQKDTQCISVEAVNGLYVSSAYTVTHNTLNFAIAYGMEARGLADRLNIPIDEAEELMRLYFEGFPAVKVWMERQVAFGRAHGYVLTKFGRKVPIWEYLDERRWIREKGDRLCINAPIQGGATGDYMRLAMVRAQRAINKAGMADDIKMCMNIHDALEFYVRRTISPQRVIDILATPEFSSDAHAPVLFPVDGWPAMQADWHMGLRWGQMVDILVDEDGRAHIQKPKTAVVEQETEPEAFEDDETADEIQLPAVDLGAIKAVLGKAPEPAPEPVHQLFAVEPEQAPPWEQSEEGPETGKHVIVKIAEMPDSDSYVRFMNLLDSRPGYNVIVLSTPQGDLELGSAATSLSPANSAEISLILHGARVFYAAEDVDPSAVLSGLQL